MADEIDDHAIAYDFVQLGEKLADVLVQAAQEQVARANQVLDQSKSMADIIRTQVAAQAKQIGEMNVRFRAFGEQMLDAHRVLNGNGPVIRERIYDHGADATAYSTPSDLAKLRALDAAFRSDYALHLGTVDPEPSTDPKREDVARRELSGSLAADEPHAPVGYAANQHDDGGVDFSKISRKGRADDIGERRTSSAAAGPARETGRTRD